MVDRLAEAAVGLFVVDEAHCVSEWGHDFRTDYLSIGAAVERLGHPAVVALTATAAPPGYATLSRAGRRGERPPRGPRGDRGGSAVTRRV